MWTQLYVFNIKLNSIEKIKEPFFLSLSPPSAVFHASPPSLLHIHKLYSRRLQMLAHWDKNREGIFLYGWGMERTLVLLFHGPVFFSSFIQSCKAAVWCHQSQSVCTSCTALIGRNDLRMSLHTLICFSLWPICFPILPRAAGVFTIDTQAGSSHAPLTHHAASPSLLCLCCFCDIEISCVYMKKKNLQVNFSL